MFEELQQRLSSIPNLELRPNAPLAHLVRFGFGGPAGLLVETSDEVALVAAAVELAKAGVPYITMGGGTNLVVADEGFSGAVLRFKGCRIEAHGKRVAAGAGASLQKLVDFTIQRGLAGLETLAGIPGTVGAAIYGNAGAYGHSISETVARVRFFDGTTTREIEGKDCEFRYRESIFKRNPRWLILSAELQLSAGDREAMERTARDIQEARRQKFPEEMKCAGSVFKNLLFRELPESARAAVPPDVVREGKVPAAWFLEQVGAKGMRCGGICVADYHANLIYNDGAGMARDFLSLVEELKRRVRERFGLELEEEVQYMGFESRHAPAKAI